MSVILISNYYAEWIPANSPDKPGVGRIHLSELIWLTNLHSDDFRNLLHLLQTEKPIYWDKHGDCLRTSHPQSLDAEPVGDQEGHG